MSEPVLTSSWCTAWGSYNTPRLWAMVKDEDDPEAWRQVAAWGEIAGAMKDQRSLLVNAKEALVAAWPPDRNDSSAAFVAEVDKLIARMDAARTEADDTATGLANILEALRQARSGIEPLWEQYKDKSDDLVPAWWDNAEDELDEQARAHMITAEQIVQDNVARLRVPDPYELNPQDPHFVATPLPEPGSSGGAGTGAGGSAGGRAGAGVSVPLSVPVPHDPVPPLPGRDPIVPDGPVSAGPGLAGASDRPALPAPPGATSPAGSGPGTVAPPGPVIGPGVGGPGPVIGPGVGGVGPQAGRPGVGSSGGVGAGGLGAGGLGAGGVGRGARPGSLPPGTGRRALPSGAVIGETVAGEGRGGAGGSGRAGLGAGGVGGGASGRGISGTTARGGAGVDGVGSASGRGVTGRGGVGASGRAMTGRGGDGGSGAPGRGAGGAPVRGGGASGRAFSGEADRGGAGVGGASGRGVGGPGAGGSGGAAGRGTVGRSGAVSGGAFGRGADAVRGVGRGGEPVRPPLPSWLPDEPVGAARAADHPSRLGPARGGRDSAQAEPLYFDPDNPWQVAEGVEPVIAPGRDTARHDPGPNVIGWHG